jgi:hypothetical protein
MPHITVTFHGESSLETLDEQIDAIPGKLELREHAVPFANDLEEDVHLEPAVERRGHGIASASLAGSTLELGDVDSGVRRMPDGGLEAILEQRVPEVIGAQVI